MSPDVVTYTTLMKTFMRAKKFEKVCHCIFIFVNEIKRATCGNLHTISVVSKNGEISCFHRVWPYFFHFLYCDVDINRLPNAIELVKGHRILCTWLFWKGSNYSDLGLNRYLKSTRKWNVLDVLQTEKPGKCYMMPLLYWSKEDVSISFFSWLAALYGWVVEWWTDDVCEMHWQVSIEIGMLVILKWPRA